jgi:hypothetical protein
MKIKYTYLLLESDTIRHSFVHDMVRQHPIIDIYPAINARNPKDLAYVYQILKDNNISIAPNRDPSSYSNSVDKKTLESKMTIYVAYMKLLEKYMTYDYVVVLQDDAYFLKNTFEKDIEQLISSGYINKIPSARLGQYMSGTIYSQYFLSKYLLELKKTGIVKPLDHYLAGLDSSTQFMRPFKKKMVEVKNFRSNIYGDRRYE